MKKVKMENKKQLNSHRSMNLMLVLWKCNETHKYLQRGKKTEHKNNNIKNKGYNYRCYSDSEIIRKHYYTNLSQKI